MNTSQRVWPIIPKIKLFTVKPYSETLAGYFKAFIFREAAMNASRLLCRKTFNFTNSSPLGQLHVCRLGLQSNLARSADACERRRQ